MKKFSFLLAFVAVISLILSACAPQATPEPTEEVMEPTEEVAEPTEEVAEPTEEEAAAPFEDVTIDFWHVYSDEPGEAMQGLVDDFNETNPYGITVQAFDQGGWTDIEDKVNAGIQSGDLPDVIMAYPNRLADWYSIGTAIDLAPYIEDSMYGLTSDELNDLYPHLKAAGTTPDGAWIAYPLTQSANVVVYNKTWAAELGYSAPPQTSAEFLEMACAGAAANAEKSEDFAGTGGLVYLPGATSFLNWLFAFGGDTLNEDQTAYDFSTQEAVDSSMFIMELKNEGCAYTYDGYPNPEQAQRRALFTTSSTAGLPYYESAFADAENDDEWGFFAFPGPDGQKAVDAYTQMIGVMAGTEESETASWLFIKWLTSPEIQAQWVKASGYYGTHYSTEELLADYMEENPIWATGVSLASLGPSEPQTFTAWSSVRRAIDETDAELYNAADQAEVESILDTLTVTANDLVAEVQ